MNFIQYNDTITNNKNNEKIYNNSSDNKFNKILNFIYNSNKKQFKKESNPENENNSNKISSSSLKREIVFKLSSYSQESQKVKFSSRIEEIEDDTKNDLIEDNYFLKLSNKKFNTPPRNTKSSYKKTKEHIKTPYKTTKSHSSKNKSKNMKEKNKSNISTKSSNYWKTLLYDDETIINNYSQEQELGMIRNCNSAIFDNPYNNKDEYHHLFCEYSIEDNEEDLNKSF